jgi:hypothetical protein
MQSPGGPREDPGSRFEVGGRIVPLSGAKQTSVGAGSKTDFAWMTAAQNGHSTNPASGFPFCERTNLLIPSCSIIPGFALVSIATIHDIFRADRPCANCNSVTCAELSSVRGPGPPPRCSQFRCRSPCSSRQHLLPPRLRRLRLSARRRAVPRCRR